MPQNQITRPMKLAQFAFGAAAVALVAFGQVSAARAGDDELSSQESFSDKFWRTLGVKNPTTTDNGPAPSARPDRKETRAHV